MSKKNTALIFGILFFIQNSSLFAGVAPEQTMTCIIADFSEKFVTARCGEGKVLKKINRKKLPKNLELRPDQVISLNGNKNYFKEIFIQ